MPTRTFVSRYRHIAIHTALVLLIAGCTKGDAPRADSSAASGQSVPVSSLKASTTQLPGALTKPLDSYTGDELYAFVHALSFTADSVKDRKCKNDPACTNSPTPTKIKVGVAAVVGQDSLSAGTTPRFGVVYVRATNRGNAEEARYSMKAGKQFEFYMVVLPDSAGGMKWRLEQVDNTTGARSHASIGTGVFQGCNHPWAKGARADFKTCANSAAAHDSVVKLGLMKIVDEGSDPIWSACATGCCVGTT